MPCTVVAKVHVLSKKIMAGTHKNEQEMLDIRPAWFFKGGLLKVEGGTKPGATHLRTARPPSSL
jgi:hypothetical protein